MTRSIEIELKRFSHKRFYCAIDNGERRSFWNGETASKALQGAVSDWRWKRLKKQNPERYARDSAAQVELVNHLLAELQKRGALK